MAPAPVALALGFGLPYFTVLSEKDDSISLTSGQGCYEQVKLTMGMRAGES